MQNNKNLSIKFESKLRKANLFDDFFFQYIMNGHDEIVEYILKTITSINDLVVKNVVPQDNIKNIKCHSVVLDIKATDSLGRYYNIEVQKESRHANPKRARYYMSMMDTELLSKTVDFDNLPETYVIFITEKDYFGKNKPLYWFIRKEKNLNLDLNDKTHIIYVNGSYNGNDPIGKLIHDFNESDPAKIINDDLRKRITFVKTKDREVNKVFETIERERMEERTEIFKKMLKNGVTAEQIASMTGFRIEEVKESLK